MIQISTLLIFVLVFSQMSCKKSPTEPESKNPREYTWDATMLTYPKSGFTSMYSIWGSSPTDVYVSGFNSLGPPMYHFDGKEWRPLETLPRIATYVYEITGFAANDIWAAGDKQYLNPDHQRYVDSALVFHFDGANWRSMLPSHLGVRGLKSIWGSSAQNLYFGSRDGKVLRFDGTKWSVDTLYLGLSIPTIGGDETRVFAMGNTWKGTLDDSVMCFLRTTGGWTLIDVEYETSWFPRFGLLAVYSPVAGIYYNSGYNGIFRWEAVRWLKVFNPSYATVVGLGGTGVNNILAVGWRDGPVIYHWDGIEWAEIKLPGGLVPNDILLYSIWTNGKEAFIVGNNGAVSYVLHGK